jgi:hypothetical protein
LVICAHVTLLSLTTTLVAIPASEYGDDHDPSPATITSMSPSEGLGNKFNSPEALSQQFLRLRQMVHESMKVDEKNRLEENPKPTDEELYMGAFKEWLEPQVRDAISMMYKKGYATQSSGFHGTKPEQQSVDGYFTVSKETKSILNAMGIDVLRGADIGIPQNKHITILRFVGTYPSVAALKKQWDALAEALPENKLPEGLRPICDRAEEFRTEFAPEHPSLEEARMAYDEYVQRDMPLIQ